MPWIGLLMALGLGFWAAALAVDGLPALRERLALLASLASGAGPLPQLVEHLDPPARDSAVERPVQLLDPLTLRRLKDGDRQWLPRSEVLPDGRVRYIYRRRQDEAPLGVPQLKAMLVNPPQHEREYRAIHDLAEALNSAGVRLMVMAPRKVGAAAEWDHGNRTLRLRSEVIDKGALEVARVLNHEAIHVAQSCSGGHLRAFPRSLGLAREMPDALRLQLQEPLYGEASARERVLEEEAYANQHRLELGGQLVRQHCRALR